MGQMLNDAKVRELETKYSLALTDLILVEDNDGTKTTPVSSFQSILSKSLYFNTIEELKSASFKEGDVAVTLGYHKVGDGGGGTYSIVYAPTDLDDGGLVHYLHTSDTLRAHLIYGSELNILQLGAYGDGEHDDSSIINTALSLGKPIYFPKREYKVMAPIEPQSNSIIDFNGSTIICPIASAICIGLYSKNSNIRICNGYINGLSGIELYSMADRIFIDNMTVSQKSKDSSFGISINGSTNVTITNNNIGESNTYYSLSKGIVIKHITKNSVAYIPENIIIANNNILATDSDISIESQQVISGIIISNNILTGKNPNTRSGILYSEAIGINVSANTNDVAISNCIFKNLRTGVNIPGVVSANVFSTDNVAIDVQYMYNLSSSQAALTLNGVQKNTKTTTTDVPYMFNNITGQLYINTNAILANGDFTWFTDDHNTGTIIDALSPYNSKDAYTSSDISSSAIVLKTIRSTTVEYSGGGVTINNITNGMNGQVILLSSTSALTLQASTNIILARGASSIVLSESGPVMLRNSNGRWTQIN